MRYNAEAGGSAVAPPDNRAPDAGGPDLVRVKIHRSSNILAPLPVRGPQGLSDSIRGCFPFNAVPYRILPAQKQKEGRLGTHSRSSRVPTSYIATRMNFPSDMTLDPEERRDRYRRGYLCHHRSSAIGYSRIRLVLVSCK